MSSKRGPDSQPASGQPGTADELAFLLLAQSGVITVRQASAFLSPSQLRHRVATGRWRRIHRGVLITHNGPIDEAARLWMAVLAGGGQALAAGATALVAHGLDGFRSTVIDILLPAQCRADRLPGSVRAHRTRVLPACDRRAAGRLPATSPARAVVDAAAWARSDRQAQTVLAMAFQQRLVTIDEVREVCARLGPIRRSRLIRTTAADAGGGAHSLGELDLLRLLRAAGLPLPVQQKPRLTSDGRRRYLDFYYEEYRLQIEIDGAYHLDPGQAWADNDRQNRLWVKGDRVLRFPAWLLREDPAAVIDQIRAALHAAGYPSATR